MTPPPIAAALPLSLTSVSIFPRVFPLSLVSAMWTWASALPWPRDSRAFARICAVCCLGLAVDDLDRPLVEHRHRPDLDLDRDLVGVVALAIEHLRARNTGRDALDVHQRVKDLVDGSIDLERVLEVHVGDAKR